MTIANRDAQLAAWLDEYSPALDVERQAALLAAAEARLDAAPPRPWLFASPRQMALFTTAAAAAVLFGIWAGGGVAQGAAPVAMASLLLGG